MGHYRVSPAFHRFLFICLACICIQVFLGRPYFLSTWGFHVDITLCWIQFCGGCGTSIANVSEGCLQRESAMLFPTILRLKSCLASGYLEKLPETGINKDLDFLYGGYSGPLVCFIWEYWLHDCIEEPDRGDDDECAGSPNVLQLL
ncbi:hypothetical protein DPMN_035265 [Dreissena polymorpha]|uniref:Uncharacterized protein n=1 Tax=Dreissena polymorpha TaxID=45954 RepID=A0A9D4MAL1_DREPO|nr:hypothetical protein DPMN_035265 [Dreissena polymorpha]